MPPATTPGPSAWEIARRLLSTGYDRLAWMRQDFARYGPLVRYPALRSPVFALADPRQARQVLEHRAERYRRGPFLSRLGRLFGRGLLTAEGELWATERRLIQPALRGQGLGAMAQRTGERAWALATGWAGRGPHAADVFPDLRELMLRVIVDAVLGSVDEAWFTALDRSLATTRDEVHRRIESLIAWPEWLPLPSHRRMAAAIRELDGLVAEVLAARRAAAPGGGNVLAHLLAAPAPDPTQLRDEILTLLQAGHLTSAVGLSWTLALLAAHPEVQERAAAEAASVTAGGPPRLEHVPSLQVCQGVVDESLRLYPPIWVIDRVCLVEDELDGHRIPAGALLLVSPYFVHRGAGPEPERFDPERFAAGPRPEAYMPFGAGPRTCVGATLARTQLVLALAALLARNRIALAGPFPSPHAALLLAPRGGLALAITPRADRSGRSAPA